MTELGECLVDGLSGRPDELGQLLLGHVVGDQQSVRSEGPKFLAEFHEGFRDATGYIREDQVGHRFIGATETTGQGLQESGSHSGATFEEGHELIVAEGEDDGVGKRGRRGGAQSRVEKA